MEREAPARPTWLLVASLIVIPRAGWPQGDPIGPEFRVNTYTTNAQSRPVVAADSAGNFVVVWESADQSTFMTSPFGQRYADSGAPLGPEFLVNDTYPTGSERGPSLAADSAGNFVVVWQIEFLSGSSMAGQRYASSGSPLGSDFIVNSPMFWPIRPAVTADSSGNFVVAWAAPYSGPSIFASRYAGSGSPLGAPFRVNGYQPGDDPTVAADSTGNFVVVWSGNGSGDPNGVFGQRYASSGIPLGGEFRVNTFTPTDQRQPSVAADSSGNFVVAWVSQFQGPASVDDVYAQRFASSGAPLGPEFRVNTFTTGLQRHPSVTTDAAGNFVVVWDGPGPDDPAGVFGQRYAASGEPLGPEFRVNTYTTDDQEYPAVAGSAVGNFVVVWESNLQDGLSDGVFAQRFNMIVPVELTHFRVE